jgi:hypothetical protein
MSIGSTPAEETWVLPTPAVPMPNAWTIFSHRPNACVETTGKGSIVKYALTVIVLIVTVFLAVHFGLAKIAMNAWESVTIAIAQMTRM